jgi:hypothetical protein
MASDVMSLFGLDPAILQQQRVQGGVDQASRMDKDYAIGAAGGQMLGAGINTAFGLQTPDMQQAASVQGGMEGADLTSAQGLRMAASKMMTSGNYAQGMALYQKASAMEQEANEEQRAQQSHAFGLLKEINGEPIKNEMGQITGYHKKLVRVLHDGTIIPINVGDTPEGSKSPKIPSDVNKKWVNGKLVVVNEVEEEPIVAPPSAKAAAKAAKLRVVAGNLPEGENKERILAAATAVEASSMEEEQAAFDNKLAYLEESMTKAQADLDSTAYADGSGFIKGGKHGRALLQIRSIKDQWLNLTGTEWAAPK